MQPVNLSDRLEVNQPMKEPEIIVANRTHRLSNRRCESFEDKASAGASWGCTEMRASNQAVVIVNKFCSVVKPATRMQFKWNNKCDEPVKSWRNQHFQTSWVYASGKHFGVGETAWLQGLVSKAGSIRIPSRARKGKVCDGMRNANATFGTGDSDQVIVPMTAMITRGERKGPVDTAAAGSGMERPILRKGYRGQTSPPYGSEGKDPNKRTADKPYSNGIPPEARACVYNEVTGRGMVIVEVLCLKPYWGNLVVRNSRGGAGNRIGISALTGG